MMSKVKNKKKKAEKGNELLENPEVLAEQLSKTEAFLEQNRKIVIAVIGTLAVLASAVFLYRYYIANQDNQAQIDMFQAVYYFEADSVQKALMGDGNNYGFLDIIENYGMTETANLAHYYAGACYLQMGEYENAIENLSDDNYTIFKINNGKNNNCLSCTKYMTLIYILLNNEVSNQFYPRKTEGN